jgi:hypothetical protein
LSEGSGRGNADQQAELVGLPGISVVADRRWLRSASSTNFRLSRPTTSIIDTIKDLLTIMQGNHHNGEEERQADGL